MQLSYLYPFTLAFYNGDFINSNILSIIDVHEYSHIFHDFFYIQNMGLIIRVDCLVFYYVVDRMYCI